MRDCLSKINWEEVLQNKDVENMWTAVMAVLNNAIDIYISLFANWQIMTRRTENYKNKLTQCEIVNKNPNSSHSWP